MRSKRWLLALSLAMVAPLRAQTGEVVQATPSAAAVDALNRHLASLSRNPQDVNALLGAGQAALDLGDVQAANGFFTRANMVDGSNGRAKLGLAVVQIALKQPADAAANFDAAAALGVRADAHLADRGLAYDLTGQQAKAQQDYRAALAANPGDSIARLRNAVSLGIAGNWAEADRWLEPALANGDREAWRMRAFILAMNGRITEARGVTQSMMPKGLADALDPYLARLPLLTPAQKAAATHYGDYPANVLRLAAPEPLRARDRDVQVAAAPESNRRDRRSRTTTNADRRTAAQPATSAAPVPSASQPAASAVLTPPPPPPPPPVLAPSQPVVQPIPAAPDRALAANTAPVTAAPSSSPAQAPVVRAQSTTPIITPAPAAPRPAVTTVQPAPRPTVAASPPAVTAAPPAQSQPRASLADAISAVEVPEHERQASVASADMATVARIQEQRRQASEAAAARARVEAEAKAKAEAARKAEAERRAKLAANPSRHWVQLAAGRDADALAFDLRRLRRTYADALGDHDGWVAVWGQTRRLLIGPFRRPEDARAVVSEIKKAGGDAFFWQSEAGEEVTKLGGR